jgi:NtrC-family two-component system response regulator AlgB
MKLLLSYSWPGNVRELSNVIERACILCEGDRIDVEHLPTELVTNRALPTGLKAAVEEFERRHMMLEIDPATLYRRLAKYGDPES